MVNRYSTRCLLRRRESQSRTSDLDFNGLKNDYGFGVRFHTPLATPLRIEVARSPEGLSFIFASGASF
jgi:outer membrane translocation and assembly module TamA